MFIIIIRTAFLYILIIAAVRFMGKRQIGDLQTTELVVTMLLSDIASLAVENTSKPLMGGVIPMAVLVVFEVLLSGAMIKSSRIRKLICGSPIVVINNGKIEQAELKRLRMSVDDLNESLRQQGIFSFDDVKYGIVETNGILSVMKKPDNDQPTLSDLNIKKEDKGIEAVVISDGTISDFSMKLADVDESFINSILKSKKIKMDEVFIMTVNRKREYNIIKRSDLN